MRNIWGEPRKHPQPFLVCQSRLFLALLIGDFARKEAGDSRADRIDAKTQQGPGNGTAGLKHRCRRRFDGAAEHCPYSLPRSCGKRSQSTRPMTVSRVVLHLSQAARLAYTNRHSLSVA
jgi:hypothetical protein